uniref:PremRNAprocessing factor 39 putative n=1 Tax=Albugo laibachii Nc14 TaxID=890382 RepID=F0WJZ4_9STRA|nr:premRNAprocessing factor 39 putative [Albugo laibachii Nc14]|eukprot:CCA21596.1 premRNAprocessing factor 39 putative [Albugo laibachii Nc14]
MASAVSNGSGKAAVKTPYEKFDEIVEKNPLDFNSWVQLLTLVDTEPSMTRDIVVSTYNRFLSEFPLCFGYWNKYAQYEYSLGKKNGEEMPLVDSAEAIENAKKVYERGILAVRYSVDMWLKYVDFLIQTLNVSADQARAILDRAVEAVGCDPLAGSLWEKYLQLETQNNDMLRLNQIFKRIMHQPLNNLEDFWEKYNHFFLAQQLHTLATSEELNEIAGQEEIDEGLLRVKLVNVVENIKIQTTEVIQKRQAFEAGIDRTYFHVTPVSSNALRNWHAYLDYEEIAGDAQRCEHLYERCLIACANYDIMWVRYAQWKERVYGFEAAKEVFKRATSVYLKYRSAIYLEYALFLEANNKLDAARKQYRKTMDCIAPTHAEAFIQLCNLERRQGNIDAVKAHFETGIQVMKDNLVNQTHEAYAFLTIWYVDFVIHELEDLELARALLVKATSEVTKSLVLWLHYIHFEQSVGKKHGNKGAKAQMIESVNSIFNAALRESCELNVYEKNDLWYQYIEFLKNHGSSAQQVRQDLEKEVTWKRKNGMPRHRFVKILRLEGGADEGYSTGEVGFKRSRTEAHSATGTATTAASTPSVHSVNGATPTAASYAQFYQQYQGFGAASGYTPATSAQYGSYGSFYPQQ